ncbi:MAG: hypothetical protein AAGA24_04635 [Pseudomonadota bacterium]
MTASLKNQAAMRVRKAGMISPLLQFLAGGHADAIAAIWPAPHEAFFALPSARRHALAILVHRPDGEIALSDLRRLVERARDSQLARLIARGQEAPGLMRALAKMGEVLWLTKDYDAFLDLFFEPNANRVLRHIEALKPSSFAPLSALPQILRERSLVEQVPNLPAAIDLASAFDLAVRIRGEGVGRQLAQRWSRAKHTRQLFDMAIEDLYPDVFRVPDPVPQLGAPFERVMNRKQLNALAQEFQNCLRDFTTDIAIGRMVVFAWRGEPNAVIALNWDAAGWRLAEAESKHNEGLDDEIVMQIAADVERAGGRLGPAVNTLAKRLHQRGYGDASIDPPGTGWADRLELGDLWD